MEGLYGPGLPLVRQCLYQFEGLTAEHLPRLSAHFARECIHPSMYASQWFITVFSYSLPWDVVLRVWDCFMLEGIKIVFQVGIALLQASEEDLLALPFEALAANLRHFPCMPPPAPTGPAATGALYSGSGGDGGNGSELDPDEVLGRALSLRLSRRLEELRVEFLDVHGEHGEEAKGVEQT